MLHLLINSHDLLQLNEVAEEDANWRAWAGLLELETEFRSVVVACQLRDRHQLGSPFREWMEAATVAAPIDQPALIPLSTLPRPGTNQACELELMRQLASNRAEWLVTSSPFLYSVAQELGLEHRLLSPTDVAQQLRTLQGESAPPPYRVTQEGENWILDRPYESVHATATWNGENFAIEVAVDEPARDAVCTLLEHLPQGSEVSSSDVRIRSLLPARCAPQSEKVIDVKLADWQFERHFPELAPQRSLTGATATTPRYRELILTSLRSKFTLGTTLTLVQPGLDRSSSPELTVERTCRIDSVRGALRELGVWNLYAAQELNTLISMRCGVVIQGLRSYENNAYGC